MSVLPGDPPARDGITGTRPKAAIRREVADRLNAAARHQGITLLGWQVRHLLATLLANQESPTDDDLTRALMRADWYRKPRHRQWRLGEQGWRVRS